MHVLWPWLRSYVRHRTAFWWTPPLVDVVHHFPGMQATTTAVLHKGRGWRVA